MSADDDSPNGELEQVLAGEDKSALGTAAGERDLGPDEPGGSEPPPEPADPSSWPTRDRRHRHARRARRRRARGR